MIRTDPGRGGGGGGRHPGYGEAFTPPGEETLRAIVIDGDAPLLVAEAERVGQALAAANLTTSQIRAFFGAVRSIEAQWPSASPETPEAVARVRRAQRELLLLRPKLAYQARRAQGQGVTHLRRVLDPAIDMVGDDRTRFEHFLELFEAILAYHRAAGGR